MNKVIEILKKCQKHMEDFGYPGCPYQLTIVIDLEAKTGYMGYYGSKELSIDDLIKEVNNELIYQCLGAERTQKGSWLVDQHMEDFSQYLDYEEEDFYIDNLNAWRFYFALNSAIVHNKSGYLFACIDDECECVDVKIVHTPEEAEEYYQNNFGGDDDE